MTAFLMFMPLFFILLCVCLAVILSFRKLFRLTDRPASAFAAISVVAAAKNEEQNIPRLIKALSQLDYPADKYEVILVDDNSEDQTYETACRLIKELPCFRIIKAENKKYPAKKGALEAGIAIAENEFVVTTDADCIPDPRWLRSFSSGFLEGNDFVLGCFTYRKTRTLTNAIARFTALRNLMLTFTAADRGMPYSAMGSSFGFRLKAFKELGGYGNTLQTLSGDDDLLLREACIKGFKTGIAPMPGNAVITDSKQSFGEYLIQKARHTSTSNYYRMNVKIMLAVWHLSNLIMVFSPLLSFYSALFFIPFAVKISADIITVILVQKKNGYYFNIPEIIVLQVFYEVMLIINYLNGTFRPRRWK